jgi:hypothetical protein
MHMLTEEVQVEIQDDAQLAIINGSDPKVVMQEEAGALTDLESGMDPEEVWEMWRDGQYTANWGQIGARGVGFYYNERHGL